MLQMTDELMGIGQLGRRDDLFLARFRLAIADIVTDRAREQMRIL